MTHTRGSPSPKVVWGIRAVAAIILLAGAAVYAARSRVTAIPLCVAEAVPEQARLIGDTWVWLERSERAASVVSVRAGRRILIARHEDVASLYAAPDAVAWIGKEGDDWAVRKADLGGSNPTEARRLKDRPLAVWTDGRRTAWVVEPASPPTVAGFLPPLGRRTQVWFAAGDASHPIAEIAEGLASADILGVHNGVLYLVGVREEGIHCSVFYAVEADKPPRRFAGETGATAAVMASDGRIFWTAPSRGSNSMLTACIRGVQAGGLEPLTVADWLPAGGRLHNTARGLIVTGAGTETAWRIVPSKRLGEPLPMLPDQWPVAAGGHVLLTVHRARTPGRVVVSTVRVP